MINCECTNCKDLDQYLVRHQLLQSQPHQQTNVKTKRPLWTLVSAEWWRVFRVWLWGGSRVLWWMSTSFSFTLSPTSCKRRLTWVRERHHAGLDRLDAWLCVILCVLCVQEPVELHVLWDEEDGKFQSKDPTGCFEQSSLSVHTGKVYAKLLSPYSGSQLCPKWHFFHFIDQNSLTLTVCLILF